MKLDEDIIHAIGLWSVRIILVTGAVIAAVLGEKNTAGTLALIAFASFLWL